MSERSSPHLIRAQAVRETEAEFHHPWNPASHIVGTHLSKLGGLERTGVSIARVPAGKESFAYHSHHCEEEWLYILSGRGIAEIDGVHYAIGAGDFLSFPAPSVAHHVRNPFDTDLVYLMGGEHRSVEIADFPRLNRRMVRIRDKIEVFPMDGGKELENQKRGKRSEK